MTQSYGNPYQDFLVVRHPDGTSEQVSAPPQPGDILRMGRELDNDIVLNDPRSSRHHAEVRRMASGDLEIRDLESANKVLMGDKPHHQDGSN